MSKGQCDHELSTERGTYFCILAPGHEKETLHAFDAIVISDLRRALAEVKRLKARLRRATKTR